MSEDQQQGKDPIEPGEYPDATRPLDQTPPPLPPAGQAPPPWAPPPQGQPWGAPSQPPSGPYGASSGPAPWQAPPQGHHPGQYPGPQAQQQGQWQQPSWQGQQAPWQQGPQGQQGPWQSAPQGSWGEGPYPGQPGPPAPRKSRKPLWIALGVVVALLLLGGAAIAALMGGKSAETACDSSSCTLTMRGQGSGVDLKTGSETKKIRQEGIDGSTGKFSVDGAEKSCRRGDTVEAAGLKFRCDSVDGDTLVLVVRH